MMVYIYLRLNPGLFQLFLFWFCYVIDSYVFMSPMVCASRFVEHSSLNLFSMQAL